MPASGRGRLGAAALLSCMAVLAPLAAGAAAPSPAAPARAVGGGWGRPRLLSGIPGLERPGVGGASVTGASCPTASWCAVGGTYVDGAGHVEAFVTGGDARDAGVALEVPGLGAMNTKDASLASLSCGAAGFCAAGGSFDAAGDVPTAWLDTERHGVWQTATVLDESPTGIGADVTALSCRTATACTGVGMGQDGLPFVVEESGGTWSDAEHVPGVTALGSAGALTSVSCTGATSCAAAGFVGSTLGEGNLEAGQVVVADERDGRWGDATLLEGVAHLNVGGAVTAPVVSCGATGRCAVAGSYTDAAAGLQVYVATSTDGTWSEGQELPGSRSLNGGAWATVAGLSCEGRTCTLVAQTSDHAGAHGLDVDTAVTSSEHLGSWSAARRLPGEPLLDVPVVEALACWAPGGCAAIGRTTPLAARASGMVFAAEQLDGTWTDARPVPAATPFARAVLRRAELGALACAAPSSCLAGGFEQLTAGSRAEVVLLAESPPPVVTHLSRSQGPTSGGTVLLVYGRHLDGATAVDVGTRPARHLVVLDDDAVRVVTPPGHGVVEVRVTTPGGTSDQPAAERFRYVP